MHPLDAPTAANRFGLGARPGELATIATDPRGWLLAQLEAPTLPPELFLPDGGARVRAGSAMRRMAATSPQAAALDIRDVVVEEAGARTLARARSDQPFFERWVAMLSNHLTVSALRPEVRFLAAVHEREAVRPHALGSYADLLLASTGHPGMLLYLDNVTSVGPDSPAGRRSGRGLNENLAREVLELHTLGVDGGYTQSDVVALALLLTGWSVLGRDLQPGDTTFVPERHQPGTVTLLGTSFGGQGARDAEDALRFLATRPATARHLARRIGRHFVADDPPAAFVDGIASVFLETDGDLGAVARAVVTRPEAWGRPLGKLKTPDDLVLSTARALGMTDAAEPLLLSLRALGQLPFTAPSPAGWPDTAEAWISPASTLARVDWVQEVVETVWDQVSAPDVLAEALLGDHLSDATRTALAGRNRAEALALVLVSPEFQRR